MSLSRFDQMTEAQGGCALLWGSRAVYRTKKLFVKEKVMENFIFRNKFSIIILVTVVPYLLDKINI